MWTHDVGNIAQKRIDQVRELTREGAPGRSAFETFLQALRDSLNPGVSEKDAIEMIASFEITQPIFDVLFANPEVVRNNPVSAGMARVINDLHEVGLSDSTRDPKLRDLYSQVRVQASQITTDSARQTLVKDFYNDFFKDAFHDTSDKMGIVYTPIEIVDAQLHMVERILQKDFGLGLASHGVHVLDGFAGTGTYICRLIESAELIPDNALPYKYTSELHSNEIVPMAAAIMSINCEESYHSRMGGEYVSFPGALLADTFQMSEDNNTIDDAVFTENSERMREQMQIPINVIIGNPPYSIGQKMLMIIIKINNMKVSIPILLIHMGNVLMLFVKLLYLIHMFEHSAGHQIVLNK